MCTSFLHYALNLQRNAITNKMSAFLIQLCFCIFCVQGDGVYYSDFEYYALIDDVMNFYDANNVCQSWFGTSLATVINTDQNAIAGDLCNLATQGNGWCWIGFTDMFNEGQWEWIDGVTNTTKFNYTNWSNSGGDQPNDAGTGEDS